MLIIRRSKRRNVVQLRGGGVEGHSKTNITVFVKMHKLIEHKTREIQRSQEIWSPPKSPYGLCEFTYSIESEKYVISV